MNKPLCTYCSQQVSQSWSAINRAIKLDKPIYCDRKCAGLGRRKNVSEDEQRDKKRLYDTEYRNKNKRLIKIKKAAYFQDTYNPGEAALKRKDRMPYHVEYCRQPEYIKWKRDYDRQYRAKKYYGELWEAAIILWDLENEILTRSSWVERAMMQGNYSKKQERRREYERLNSNKLEDSFMGNA